MQIDALMNGQAAIQASASDLLDKLQTGDVIKAKVLEITSDEVLLRLSDGSVLKAAAGEDLQAKAGQMLSLTVTSKSEGTIILETCKDQAQMKLIKPDLLKNLLSSLGLKPVAGNLELAAEFIRAGIKPTAEQFAQAAFLRESAGFSAEKAVFIASKGIQADPSALELLSKLLDGDLKLGDQLKNLSTALDNATRTTAKASENNPVAKATGNPAANNGIDAEASVMVDKSLPSEKSAISGKSVLTETTALTGKTATDPNLSTIQKASANSSQSSEKQVQLLGKAQNSVDAKTMGVQPRSAAAGRAGITENARAAADNGSSTRSLNDNANLNIGRTAISRNDAVQQDHQARISAANTNLQSQQEQGITLNASDETANKAAKQMRASAGDIANSVDSKNTTSSGLFSRLQDAVRDVFISLNSDKTAAQLDLGKSHRELADKMVLLKNTLQSSGIAGHPAGEGITAATSLIDSSAKLMSQLNNSNVLYYQLPVNLTGRDTTAELYVMKRQQGKKRIDPHNSVMFVSLDTQNLGRFESLIDIKGSNITLNIRTEKQEINELIKKNIKQLYSALSESGYKLADIRYALIGSATPPLKIEQILSKMTDAGHNKVDLRI